MENAKRSRCRFSGRSVHRIAVVCAVGVAVLAGCASEKYARYEPDQDGRGQTWSEAGERVLGDAAAVVLAGAYILLWLWAASHGAGGSYNGS